jgi:hypothetical protein
VIQRTRPRPRGLVFAVPIAAAALTACAPGDVRPNLTGIDDPAAWSVVNAERKVTLEGARVALHMAPVGGDRQGSNVAMALPAGVRFTTGTIDVDLRGRGPADRSFVGVAFAVADDTHFEAVYFRPFNFRAPDAEHRARAVQYVAWPLHPFEDLRARWPGVYEAAVAPAPDPAQWFHARIEVGCDTVRVFVDDGAQPCLVVKRLRNTDPTRTGDAVGLLVDSREGAFADLRITPAR